MVTLKLRQLLNFTNSTNPHGGRGNVDDGDGEDSSTVGRSSSSRTRCAGSGARASCLLNSSISIFNFYILLFVNSAPLFCLLFLVTSSNAYTFNGSYKISPKPCTVDERTGTCMFVWECLKTEGKHLGMCVDGFMFGSCCGHNASSNFVLDHNSISMQSPSSSLLHSSSASAFVPATTSKTTTGSVNSNTDSDSSSTFHSSHESIFSTKFPLTTTTGRTTTTTPTTTTTTTPTTTTTTSTTTSTTTTTTTTTRRPATSSFFNQHPPLHAITSKPATTISSSNSNLQFPGSGSGPSSSSASPSNTVELKLPFITSNGSSLPDSVHKPFPSLTLSQAEAQTQEANPPSNSVSTGTGISSSSSGPTFSFHTGNTATSFTTSTQNSMNNNSPTSTSSTTSTTTTTTSTTTKKPAVVFNHNFSYYGHNKKTTQRPTTIFIDPQSTTTAQPNISLDKHYGCGVSPMHPQMRIVGGKEASFAQFPWQVSVRRTSFFGFSSTHRCGGALLNENWIATAGHCVDDLLTSQIRIRMGEWDFSATSEKYPHVERGVVKKVVHPSYNFFTYEHDLALIKLETPVILTPHISPICLPGNDDLLINENATVSGWGRLSEGGPLPSKLQYVSVPILSNAKCRDMFLKSGRVEHIPEIFLCAGYENGGKDSCQGDSGGPLQVRGSDNRWFLAGIISWGIGCAEPNMPGVCTRISKFTSWILKHVTA